MNSNMTSLSDRDPLTFLIQSSFLGNCSIFRFAFVRSFLSYHEAIQNQLIFEGNFSPGLGLCKVKEGLSRC